MAFSSATNFVLDLLVGRPQYDPAVPFPRQPLPVELLYETVLWLPFEALEALRSPKDHLLLGPIGQLAMERERRLAQPMARLFAQPTQEHKEYLRQGYMCNLLYVGTGTIVSRQGLTIPNGFVAVRNHEISFGIIYHLHFDTDGVVQKMFSCTYDFEMDARGEPGVCYKRESIGKGGGFRILQHPDKRLHAFLPSTQNGVRLMRAALKKCDIRLQKTLAFYEN